MIYRLKEETSASSFFLIIKMKTKLSRFLLVSVIILSLSCCRQHFAIEDRARSQVMLSLIDELHDFESGSELQDVADMKTVYVNDSICILQLTPTVKDTAGLLSEIELQYVYYVDLFLSRHSGQFVFREEFRNVPFMTDEEINLNAVRVRRNRENVYDSFIGHGNVIRDNFDD